MIVTLINMCQTTASVCICCVVDDVIIAQLHSTSLQNRLLIVKGADRPKACIMYVNTIETVKQKRVHVRLQVHTNLLYSKK